MPIDQLDIDPQTGQPVRKFTGGPSQTAAPQAGTSDIKSLLAELLPKAAQKTYRPGDMIYNPDSPIGRPQFAKSPTADENPYLARQNEVHYQEEQQAEQARTRELLPIIAKQIQAPISPYQNRRLSQEDSKLEIERQRAGKEGQITPYQQAEIDLRKQALTDNEGRTSVSQQHQQAIEKIAQAKQDLANKKMTMPTNTARAKAQQAEVVVSQAESLVNEIQNARQILGPMAGRINSIEQGIGSSDPNVSRLFTHLKSFAALQPALHGSRGIGMQLEFEKAVGSLAMNPDALIASIESLVDTAKDFEKAGGMEPPAATSTGKTATAQHIRDYAKQKGISESQARQEATAAGYVIQ